jgi:hypothetical protein
MRLSYRLWGEKTRLCSSRCIAFVQIIFSKKKKKLQLLNMGIFLWGSKPCFRQERAFGLWNTRCPKYFVKSEGLLSCFELEICLSVKLNVSWQLSNFIQYLCVSRTSQIDYRRNTKVKIKPRLSRNIFTWKGLRFVICDTGRPDETQLLFS